MVEGAVDENDGGLCQGHVGRSLIEEIKNIGKGGRKKREEVESSRSKGFGFT